MTLWTVLFVPQSNCPKCEFYGNENTPLPVQYGVQGQLLIKNLVLINDLYFLYEGHDISVTDMEKEIVKEKSRI